MQDFYKGKIITEIYCTRHFCALVGEYVLKKGSWGTNDTHVKMFDVYFFGTHTCVSYFIY